MTVPTAVDELTWSERYAASLMNTFGTPQRVLVRGEGCYVWDATATRYLDLLGGIAVNALGHAHPAVVERVTAQARHARPRLELLRDAAADRARRRSGCWQVPRRRRRAGCSSRNSGAEANEAAFKLTRRTGRTKMVVGRGRASTAGRWARWP